MDDFQRIVADLQGPRMRVLMHPDTAEKVREMFEREFPRHELIADSHVPEDMAYLMPKDPLPVPHMDFGTMDE